MGTGEREEKERRRKGFGNLYTYISKKLCSLVACHWNDRYRMIGLESSLESSFGFFSSSSFLSNPCFPPRADDLEREMVADREKVPCS